MDHDHLSTGLVGLHDAMRLTDLVETEDPDRLDVEPACRSVRRNLCSGTSESGKPGVPNTKLPKKVR